MTEHRYDLARVANIAMYGPNRPPIDRRLALIHGARKDHVCLNKAASTKHEPGFQTILESQFGLPESKQPDVYADGIIVTKRGAGVVTWRADCPTVIVVIINDNGKRIMLVLHAGRPAMTPSNRPGEPIRNIITIALEPFVKNCIKPEIHAFIIGAICGHHFDHEGPEGEELVKPFDQFGEIAFTDRTRGALDLVSIIKHQLIQLGVGEHRIRHDGVCTYESKNLASYRRDRSEARNAIVAVLY